MTRTIASIGLLCCALLSGCAADQSGAVSPQADQGYTPSGSNLPRRPAPKAEQPAARTTGPAAAGTAKPAP